MDLQRDAKIKAGASWFFWISLCTVINLVLQATHQNMRLVLGATSVEVAVDLFNRFMVAAPESKLIADYFIGLAGSSLFLILCKQASSGKSWAFMIGILLYTLDALLLLICASWTGVAIHVWALVILVKGMLAPLSPIAVPTTVDA